MKRLWWLLAIPIIIALFYFSTLSGSQKTETPVRQPDIASYEPIPPTVDEIYNLVNQERAKIGVAPLKLDPRLNQSAQEKADELVREGWDDTPHVNNTGVHGFTLVGKYMPECVTGGENLLFNVKESGKGVEWWLGSPTHREAMLDSKFTYTGIALKEINDGRFAVVEHFCQL